MRLRTKLKQLVEGRLAEPAKRTDFSEDDAVRRKIKDFLTLPLLEFCRTKPDFDMRHGLVYKTLKTDQQRLRNGVLTAHDMNYWLRRNQPVPALWVLRLAGKKGRVARNQFLGWVSSQLGPKKAAAVLNWTKKWGLPADDPYAVTAVAHSTNVADARRQYAARHGLDASARRVLGNTLLRDVASGGDADEVFAFYKSLNKDVVTFQVMLGAMLKNPPLRRFRDEVWQTALRQEAANNIVIDDKLRETHAAIERLAPPSPPPP